MMSPSVELNVKRSAMATGALALAISFAALPARAQNQSGDPQAGPPSAEAPYGGDPQQQGAPPYNPRYNGPYNAPYNDEGSQYSGPQAQGAPVPGTLTLPAGTMISVRINQWLSSDRNRPGDTFSATLDQPIVVNGWVVARRGQTVTGRVAVAEKAGHGKNESHLGLEFGELVLVDGQQVPVSSQLTRYSAGGPSTNQKVGAVAITTIIGAAIGAVAGGGSGAAIGAGVGAGAGTVGVLATHGGPTVIGPETRLTFRIEAPVDISTERSQQAFQPVGQRDYGREQDAYGGPRRYAGGPGPGYGGPGYPPPAPYYYGGYCGPWLYCSPYAYYPGPFAFGFYGGRGFGPGFRGRFRR